VAYAACRGLDVDIFYPVFEFGPDVELAKAICGTCAVREACLEYAMATRQDDGVWGGLTDPERRRLRRRRRNSA
jgi:WhiB family transcriptional regulator, redox-sensing transcriptional regulator